MTLALRARPVSRTINGTRHVPAWDIYVGSSLFPSLAISSDRIGWVFTALAGRYGVSYDDQELAATLTDTVKGDIDFHSALALVRRAIEAQHEMHRQEALAEQETERRAEQFWENRMSDEDKAREDWEYNMWGA
jgi:hypothetical protein